MIKNTATIIWLIPTFFLFNCDSREQKDTYRIEQVTKLTFPSGEWVDLSYPFDEKTIYWPTSSPFKLDTVYEGVTEKGYYYSAYRFCMAEHGGTHLDAPVHFVKGQYKVDEIPLQKLSGEAVVLDISASALKDRNYQVSISDLELWEKENGMIPKNAIVFLKTGFGSFWPDPLKYLGTNLTGEEGAADLHFPGLHPDAARWLSENRDINAIGLDTPSIDYGHSKLFESHQILFEKNILVLENVANLDRLPVKGAWVIFLPVKIKGGSGAPVRIVALVPG